MKPGLYDMVRVTDQTGVSGTGRVAQVAVFEDGSAVVRWMTGKDSTVCWAKVQDALDVHINCHPDTTKLIPVGALREQHQSPREVDESARWAAIRDVDRRTTKAIYDWCASRAVRCKEHNSHGLYFDVWVGTKQIMFDCSPEDISHELRRGKGIVVVRDASHGWDNMRIYGTINMLDNDAGRTLDIWLGCGEERIEKD